MQIGGLVKQSHTLLAEQQVHSVHLWVGRGVLGPGFWGASASLLLITKNCFHTRAVQMKDLAIQTSGANFTEYSVLASRVVARVWL